MTHHRKRVYHIDLRAEYTILLVGTDLYQAFDNREDRTYRLWCEPMREAEVTRQLETGKIVELSFPESV